MKKRQDLLAKYFATLSQIIFGAVILKQFTVKFILMEFVIGMIITITFVIIAYFIQSKS